MDLDALKIFYVVAKEKQMTSATYILGKSQPAISDRLKRFQRDLGIQLYVVGKHGIVLTPNGELLFERAQKILAEVENLKHSLLFSNEARGQLRASTTHAMASQIIVQALPRFMEEYPHIDLTLLADDKPLDLIIRETDVAIRPHMGDAPHLEQKPLMRFHIQLFASEEYLARNGTPKVVSDLENHILLSYPEDIAQPYMGVNWHLGLTPNKRRCHFKVNSSHALQKAAEMGMGIMSLSREAIILNKTKVVRVLPEINGPIVDIYYTYLKEAKDDVRINALYNVLKKHVEENNLSGF